MANCHCAASLQEVASTYEEDSKSLISSYVAMNTYAIRFSCSIRCSNLRICLFSFPSQLCMVHWQQYFQDLHFLTHLQNLSLLILFLSKLCSLFSFLENSIKVYEDQEDSSKVTSLLTTNLSKDKHQSLYPFTPSTYPTNIAFLDLCSSFPSLT